MQKKRLMLKPKVKKILISSAILILIFIQAIALVNILKWNLDNKKIKTILDEIDHIVTFEEVEEDKYNTEIIASSEDIPELNPYWDYIKMNLINVDFKELKEINSDTVGWIQVNGTNINYPFVQTTDNSYYLKHSFDKKKNGAGWVFLDYRNNISNMSKNTIIYAHSRLDKTMFGSLKNILSNGWLNNQNNYVIKLSTEYENTLWQVFSVYRIKTTNDYLYTRFATKEKFLEFAQMLIDRSAYNFNTTVSEDDYIITLSTCGDNDTKVVLHAKLIKKGSKSHIH